ncbi:MAG: GNAT family N-acetyltransferase, partial [Noviherbaspirillum sp.]
MDKLSHGRQLLSSLKATAAAGKATLALPVGHPVSAILRTIPSAPASLDPIDLQLLSEWRNRFVKSFLTEFLANDERTGKWLNNVVHKDEGKILLMVENLQGERVGHIGLGFIDWTTGYGEADAIVRGGNSPPGLMKEALQTTLKWAKDQLGLSTLGVRVRSDNTALDFYRKVGFEEIRRVPLGVTEAPDMITWFEDPSLK